MKLKKEMAKLTKEMTKLTKENTILRKDTKGIHDRIEADNKKKVTLLLSIT